MAFFDELGKKISVNRSKMSCRKQKEWLISQV